MRAVICAAQNVVEADLAAVLELLHSSAQSTCFSFAAASPVCELCASSAITAKRLPCGRCELPHFSNANGKRLDRADDDLLVPGERLRKFLALAAALALDRRHYAGRALEVEDAHPATAGRSHCGR